MKRHTESHIAMRVMGLTSTLLFFWTAISSAEEMPVPMEMQFPLFLKILTFDRNLRERAGNEIVIGIVYQSKFRTSLEIKDALVEVMDKSSIKKIEEIPVRCVAIDVDNTNLGDAISKSKVNVLYITPLRALELKRIIRVSRAQKLTTLTGVPDYVGSGLAVGIGVKGKNPRIIINLPAARAEGSNFSSQLLRLAKVIG